MSYRIIPPDIFTNIAFTGGSDVIIFIALVTCSAVAPPRKLAGSSS
jgi:hypothetical protein